MARVSAAGRGGIAVKSVRDDVSEDDGRRILVDRLWPRGVSRDRARIDEWMRDLAPSTELRRWFGHEPARWDEFRRRYRQELAGAGMETLRGLRRRARSERITFVFGARDREHNNAIALQEIAQDA